MIKPFFRIRQTETVRLWVHSGIRQTETVRRMLAFSKDGKSNFFDD